MFCALGYCISKAFIVLSGTFTVGAGMPGPVGISTVSPDIVVSFVEFSPQETARATQAIMPTQIFAFIPLVLSF
jgi:hypothetical protein